MSLTLGTNSSGQCVLLGLPTASSEAAASTEPPAPSQPDGANGLLNANDLEQISNFMREPLPSIDVDYIPLVNKLLQHATSSLSLLAKKDQQIDSLSTQLAELPQLQRTQREKHAVEYEHLSRQAKVLSKKLVLANAALNGGGGGANPTQAVKTQVNTLKLEVADLKKKITAYDNHSFTVSQSIRKLRTHLLYGTPLVATDIELALPSTSNRNIDRKPQLNRPSKLPLMGDAEAEHLLLAGKKISHIRRINRVGLNEAIVIHAKEVVNAVESGVVQVAGVNGRGRDLEHSMMRLPSMSPSRLGSTPLPATASSPVKSSTKRGRRRSSSASKILEADLQSSQTGFFAGMNDLLKAAEVIEDAPAPPLLGAREGRARKRRKTEDEHSGYLLPVSALLPSISQSASASASNGTVDIFTALDVLADQAISVSSSQSAPTKSRRKSQPPNPPRTTSLPPLDPNHSASNSPKLPSALPGDSISAPPVASTSTAVSGSAKSKVENLKAEEGSGSEKTKRERSPYIKWNLVEDEKLVQGVIKHGQRWDHVASCVPTRSYHQCRQRWLRGLKSGNNLPDELKRYHPEVKKAVQAYEDRKGKNRNKKPIGAATNGGDGDGEGEAEREGSRDGGDEDEDDEDNEDNEDNEDEDEGMGDILVDS